MAKRKRYTKRTREILTLALTIGAVAYIVFDLHVDFELLKKLTIAVFVIWFGSHLINNGVK